MIRATHGIISSNIITYDANALNILAVLNISENCYKPHFSSFVQTLKSVGAWDRILYLWMFWGDSLDNLKWNWKDLRDLDDAGRITFPTGITTYERAYITFNGTQTAHAAFNPSLKLTNNDTHLSTYFPDSIAQNISVGSIDGSKIIYLASNLGTNGYSTLNDGGSQASYIFVDDKDKVFFGNRTAIDRHVLRKEKTQVGIRTINNSQELPTIPLTLGGANQGGTDNYIITGKVAAITAGLGMTDEQCNSVVDAFHNFNIARSEASQDGIYWFGDSWTVGVLVTTAQRYTKLVSDVLGYTEHNRGISGQPLTNAIPANPTGAENFYSQAMRKIPLFNNTDSYLILGHGINDMGLNLTNYTVETFSNQLTSIINTAIAKGWPKSKIKLTTAGYCNQDGRNLYTTYGVTTPSDLTRHLAFVQATKDVATSTGVQVFDLYINIGNSDLGDNLHLNIAGNQKARDNILNNW